MDLNFCYHVCFLQENYSLQRFGLSLMISDFWSLNLHQDVIGRDDFHMQLPHKPDLDD